METEEVSAKREEFSGSQAEAPMNGMVIKIAGIIRESIVDGPGIRLTVFTQGCNHKCEGCHNPHTHDFEGGYFVQVDEIIKQMRENPLLDGITISGGEPFEQAEAAAELAEKAKKLGYNVMVYSGYYFEYLLSAGNNISDGASRDWDSKTTSTAGSANLHPDSDPGKTLNLDPNSDPNPDHNKKWYRKLLEYTDILVDGRFELSRRNLQLKFRGSENQRIIDVGESIRLGTVKQREDL